MHRLLSVVICSPTPSHVTIKQAINLLGFLNSVTTQFTLALGLTYLSTPTAMVRNLAVTTDIQQNDGFTVKEKKKIPSEVHRK